MAFLIHGGPQGSFDNDFHYRWNPQTYAGAGYAVVTIDFHGSTGYGQEFVDSIREHWGDRPLGRPEEGLEVRPRGLGFPKRRASLRLGSVLWRIHGQTGLRGTGADGFDCLGEPRWTLRSSSYVLLHGGIVVPRVGDGRFALLPRP